MLVTLFFYSQIHYVSHEEMTLHSIRYVAGRWCCMHAMQCRHANIASINAIYHFISIIFFCNCHVSNHCYYRDMGWQLLTIATLS